MPSEPANADASLQEQLVAYLDGELDADAGRRIDELLATDSEVRKRLQGLDRTWDLLDELETSAVAENSAQSTLEMVTVAAARDAKRSLAEAPGRRRRQWAITGGSLLAAALAGFLAVACLWPDPNAQLVRDLPLLEKLDQYRLIGDIEFLRTLHREGMFAEEGDTPADDSPIATPRERIERMTPAEKEELRRRQERFCKLDPAEQQRLRQLHEQLQRDGEADKLCNVMGSYCTWVMTLEPYEREALRELEPAKQIQWIANQPNPKDLEGLVRWLEGRARKTLSVADRHKLAGMPPQTRGRQVMDWTRERWQEKPRRRPPMLSDDDLASLRSHLSAKSRKRLEKMPTQEQKRILVGWIRLAVRDRRRRANGPPSPPPQEQLDHFFEQLSESEQSQLLSLPGEEMERELWRMYLSRKSPGRRGPHQSGPPRRRRPGPPGSPPPGFEPGERPHRRPAVAPGTTAAPR